MNRDAADRDIRAAMVALHPRLRRFAFGLTGSADEADDLVQAAFERALTRLHQWQPGTRLDSWMYRIVHSIRINRLKAERVRGSHLERVDPDSQTGSDGRHDMEMSLTLESIRRFLQRLPEEQRSAVLLVTVEGLSYKEAAETLGVPIGTVTSRLARARMAIAEFVDGVAG